MSEVTGLRWSRQAETRALVVTALTFYIGDHPKRIGGLQSAVDHVLATFGSRFTYFTNDNGRCAPVTAKTLTNFSKRFERRAASDWQGFHFTSGRTDNEVRAWGLDFTFCEAACREGIAGALRVTLPAAKLEKRPVQLLELTRTIGNALPFLSGHVGYGTHDDPGSGGEDDRDEVVAGWCEEHSGIDCSDISAENECTGNEIKTVSWLTLVGAPLVQRVGGRAALRAKLPSSVRIEELSFGLMIRAGKRAAVDGNDDYRAVDAVLASVRVREGMSLGAFDGDEERTARWLARFA